MDHLWCLASKSRLLSVHSPSFQVCAKLTYADLQFAGAAQSLGAGAILVNPWNIRAMYKAIDKALNMPDTERKERHLHNFAHVTKHTAQSWADTFVR